MKSESFAALRYRDFRLLWLGQLVSQSGTQMQRIAIAWQVYELTRDPIALGLIGLFRVMPIFVFALVGGMVADAQDRRRVMVFSQSAMMLSACLLALMTFTGLVSVPLIYAAVFLTAAASSFDSPARQSLVPHMVPRQYIANAFSLNSIMGEVARVVGAGLGGIVISRLGGVAVVYAINAVSFVATLIALRLMQTTTGERLEARTISLSGLLEGFRYLRRSPVIFGAMVLDFLATFWGSANALLPFYANEILHVGVDGYGLLSAAPSVGSILAGVVMSLRSDFRKPGVIMLWSVAVYGIATTLFGLSNLFVLSLFFFAFTGAGDTISMILRQTIRQLATPDYLRGRMTSINIMFAMGGPQLGELEAGLIASLFGAPVAVISGGIGCLLSVALVAKLVPALRDYDGAHLRASKTEPATAPAPAGD